jgi:hypothetical protein
MAQTLRLTDTGKEALENLKENYFKDFSQNATIEAIILDYMKVKKELQKQIKRADTAEQELTDIKKTFLHMETLKTTLEEKSKLLAELIKQK